MKRYVSLEEISDGRLYHLNDMVKADCHGCVGCSQCCKGMGNSIVLNPLDIYRLTTYLGKSFEEILQAEIELQVQEGVILPNLKMVGAREQCAFLDENGRCRVHEARPDICRLFPLGRYYDDTGFSYFLQTGECPGVRTKVKVSKWIDTPNLPENQAFVLRWHRLVKQMEQLVLSSEDDDYRKQVNMLFLNCFFLNVYDENRTFYEQFEERAKRFGSQGFSE